MSLYMQSEFSNPNVRQTWWQLQEYEWNKRKRERAKKMVCCERYLYQSKAPFIWGRSRTTKHTHTLFFHKPPNLFSSSTSSVEPVMEILMTSSQQKQQQLLLLLLLLFCCYCYCYSISSISIKSIWNSYFLVCVCIQLCNFHWHINHLFNKQVRVN